MAIPADRLMGRKQLGPAPDLVHGEFNYDHPVFDAAAIEAQGRMASLQGRGGIYYAGAWLGYGFHEDGLRSGIDAARRLGVVAPWKFEAARLSQSPAATSMGLPENAAAQFA